ncbi:hypothetical protein TOC8171_40170 [Pseudomonas syringae]
MAWIAFSKLDKAPCISIIDEAWVEAIKIPARRISAFASGKSLIAVTMHVVVQAVSQSFWYRGQRGVPSTERQPREVRPISVAP